MPNEVDIELEALRARVALAKQKVREQQQVAKTDAERKAQERRDAAAPWARTPVQREVSAEDQAGLRARIAALKERLGKEEESGEPGSQGLRSPSLTWARAHRQRIVLLALTDVELANILDALEQYQFFWTRALAHIEQPAERCYAGMDLADAPVKGFVDMAVYLKACAECAGVEIPQARPLLFEHKAR